MITVERAVASDACFIAEAEVKYIDCPWTIEQVQSELENPNVVFLTARCDGELCGYLSGSIALDECEIANVAVEIKHRRKGVAQKLFNALFDALRERNVATVFLLVRDDNVAAIALYRLLGFTDVGLRRGYYKGKNGIIMRKSI